MTFINTYNIIIFKFVIKILMMIYRVVYYIIVKWCIYCIKKIFFFTIILIKLAIIFLVLKLFFFPDFINTNAKNGDKAGFVSKEVLNR